MTDNRFNKLLALISILFCGAVLLYIALFALVPYGGNDSVFHFLHSAGLANHPDLLISHWGKPLFILLSHPFTYFGVEGVNVFNTIVMLLTAWFVHKISSKLPVAGEPDVMRLAYTLAGVSSGADGFGGMSVRGGSTNQNLILYDGVPVYNANQLFGMFSIFNSDVIKIKI